MKKNNCIDCGKRIRLESKRCTHCSHKGNLHPNYKDGRTNKENYCNDCKKQIDSRAKRCIKCNRKYQVGINNPNYKNGNFSDNQNRCIDCNKIICSCSIRCKSCDNKKRYLNSKNHPMYGKIGNLNPMYNVRRFGKSNPNYIDGRSFEPYPIEFNQGLKETIRKRDNYTCQNCGMTEEEHLIVIGTNLTVHHIDYDKKNCKKDNLITLCNQCNLRANANRDFWLYFYKQKIKCLLV